MEREREREGEGGDGEREGGRGREKSNWVNSMTPLTSIIPMTPLTPSRFCFVCMFICHKPTGQCTTCKHSRPSLHSPTNALHSPTYGYRERERERSNYGYTSDYT